MKKSFIATALTIVTALSCTACGGKQEQTVNTAVNVPSSAEQLAQVEAYMYSRDYTNAIALATEVIDTEGPSAYALTLRGISYAKIEQQGDAYADLIEAVNINYSVETLVNLGNAERQFGHCERASDAFQKASILAPNDTQILTNLASAYLCYGALEQAVEIMNKTQQINPNDEILMTNWAIYYAMNDDYAQARVWAEKAIATNPSYPSAHQILSVACNKLGDSNCAQNEAQQYDRLLAPRRFDPNY